MMEDLGAAKRESACDGCRRTSDCRALYPGCVNDRRRLRERAENVAKDWKAARDAGSAIAEFVAEHCASALADPSAYETYPDQSREIVGVIYTYLIDGMSLPTAARLVAFLLECTPWKAQEVILDAMFERAARKL